MKRNKVWLKSVYWIIRIPFTIYYKLFRNYKYEKIKNIQRPFLMLCNHNSADDQFLAGLAVKGHMLYVGSEHIIRAGFGGKLVELLGNPIIRKKAMGAEQTVQDIVSAINEGYNVCLFVEGNRSFNGQTGWISDTNGQLAKLCGADLITYKLDGGYFRTPRWAEKSRKGPIFGSIVNHYTKEQLEEMSDKQAADAIRTDLYSNAFVWLEENSNNPLVTYSGKNYAEHLELALIVCPRCENIGTLKSHKDSFYCSCGLSAQIDAYSRFTFANTEKYGRYNIANVYEWDMWQRSYIKNNIDMLKEKHLNTTLLSHSQQNLGSITLEHKTLPIMSNATMSLYSDRLVFERNIDNNKDSRNKDSRNKDDEVMIFYLKDITGFSISGRMTIFFSTNKGEYMEIKSDCVRTGVGYLMLYRYLSNLNYI